MKKGILCMVVALCLVAAAGSVFAHSTANMIKEPLTKKILTADDVAYYIEPYVVNMRDENGRRNRWFVVDFQKVEQFNNKVTAYFTVMDQKEGGESEWTLSFLKNVDGTWSHVDDDGNIVTQTVETYVPKPNTMRTVLLALLGAGLVVYLIIRTAMLIRKRKAAGKEAIEPSGAA